MKPQIIYAKNVPLKWLENTAGVERECITVGELLAADVEGVESIGAVGAVFEQVFLVFCEFLAAFVLSEAVAPTDYSCRLDGEDEVIVVLSVEHRH